jgi:hypothetical protein
MPQASKPGPLDVSENSQYTFFATAISCAEVNETAVGVFVAVGVWDADGDGWDEALVVAEGELVGEELLAVVPQPARERTRTASPP